ncbi:hypothetical protein ACOSP7_027582 [Xanthoceras sorbifolium]
MALLVGEVVAGLINGIVTMTKGERTLFMFPSELGFGVVGFNGVPPNLFVCFEVELFSWIMVVDVCKDGGIIKRILEKGELNLDEVPGLITHGCSLHEKGRGNYTIKCKGRLEYHKARTIATLQFNCHLALLQMEISGHFTLDIDEDEIREVDNLAKLNVEVGVNGHGAHE